MKTRKLILPFIVVVIAFVFGASLLLVRTEKVKAEEPTPQYTIGASQIILGTAVINNAPPFNTFNNGYSFALFGTYGSNGNGVWSFHTPDLDFDTQLLSMRVNFDNSNYQNNLTVLNFSCIGVIDSNNSEVFYRANGVNASSLDSYFDNKFITVDSSYTSIVFSFDIAVNSNYIEFAFNDFSIDFFSDIKLIYQDGYDKGFEDARTEFYQSRYDLGYNAGFIEGSNNQFSFLSYFGAIIETPINAALSLFDFDFLGFNMRSFFLSILTISLIVLIIKFVLAR